MCECIDSGWVSSEGSFVKTFEEKMSVRVGRKFGIAVSNGTACLGSGVALTDEQMEKAASKVIKIMERI